MNEILPDGNKPIQIGDPSFVYKNVYHPIIWLGADPYRPRVEMLTIKDRRYVFIRRYEKNDSDENYKYNYRIPGGSIDADSDKLQQAIAETNEEGLLAVKNAKFSGVSYYEQYQPGFLLKGGDMPIEYKGSMNDVFVAEYAGKYDKSKVEEKDLDNDMATKGKFYAIVSIAKDLKSEHIRALVYSGMVDSDIVMFLRRVSDSKGFPIEITSTDPISTVFNDNPVGIVHSFESTDIVVPGGKLYHGTTAMIDKFKPMSLDIGNINQKPGWSTFCFADYNLAKRFGLMRLIQSVTDKLDETRTDPRWKNLRCEWNVGTCRPFVNRQNFNPNLFIGEKFYVYTIAANRLKELGIGNDSKLPEYTFRDSDITPDAVEPIEVSRSMLLEEIMVVDDFGDVKMANDKAIADGGFESSCRKAMLNRDYNEDSVVGKLEKAAKTGELIPGDDIEEFMNQKGWSFDESSFIGGMASMEAVLSKVKIIKMTPSHLNKIVNDKSFAMATRHLDKNALSNPEYRGGVAMSGSTIVGYILVGPAEYEGQQHNGWIKVIEVHPSYRRQGIGKELLHYAKSELGGTHLTVNSANRGAIKMYKDDGFKEIGNNKVLFMSIESYLAEASLTAKERKAIPDKEYGLPKKRKYPMPDKKHVRAAIRFFNYVDKEDEAELARNINKMAKKYEMIDEVKVGSDNRFSKYWKGEVTESVALESFLFSKDNLYINFDKFESGKSNICLVTGISGSGKSTVAQKIADGNHAEWIELDIFEEVGGFTDSQLKQAGEVFYDYLLSKKDLWDRLKSKSVKGDELKKESRIFLEYCIGWCRKHSDSKWVIEGVQIYSYGDPDKLKSLPIVFTNASVLKSLVRRLSRSHSYRDGSFRRELSEFPQMLGYYIDNDKAFTAFKNAIVTEVSSMQSAGAGTVPFDVAKTIEDIISNDRMFISQAIWDNLDNIVYYDTEEVGNSTVGSVIVFKDHSSNVGHLMLSVDTSATGFGVANNLMDDLLRNWTNLGVNEIRVTVQEDYEEAIKLFTSYGFKEIFCEESGARTFALNTDSNVHNGTRVEEELMHCYRENMFQKYHVSPFPTLLNQMDIVFYDTLDDAIQGLNIYWPKDNGLYYAFTKIDSQKVLPVGRIILRADNWKFNGWYDCFKFDEESTNQYLSQISVSEIQGMRDEAIHLAQKVLRGEHDYGLITESADGNIWFNISTPDKIIMEAPGDDDPDTPTDYTASAPDETAGNTMTDDQPTDYTQGGTGDEPAGGDAEEEPTNPMAAPGGDDATDDTGAGGDAAGMNDPGEEPTDYTDAGADAGDDMSGGDMGEDTGGDTGTDATTSDSSNNNIVVKNYSLIKDFEKAYTLIDDINSTIDSTLKASSVQNQVLVQVSRNLSNVKDFIKSFVQFHFKDNDYSYNLYYYMIVIQFLKINLAMVEKITLLGD